MKILSPRVSPFLAAFLLTFSPSLRAETPPAPKLEVLENNYPKVIFYRFAANFKVKGDEEKDYQLFLTDWNRLMGFQMDDRLFQPDLKEKLAIFERWKKEHPDKILLWYGLGMALPPLFYPKEAALYSAGHWVYYPRSIITGDVPAQAGVTEIPVQNTDKFSIDAKRADDICLYALGADGKPDWQHAEQVKLLGIDDDKKTIRVQRGMFGTAPLAFQAGKSAAAPHAYVGPFNNEPKSLVWWYNFSSACPKDANGHTAADIYAKMWADKLKPGGSHDFADAFQLDTIVERVYSRNNRVADINNDGIADNCDIDGENIYSPGVFRALALTRAALPPGKLLVPDAGAADSRGFAAANGFESEGLPGRLDAEFLSVFSSLNQMAFALQFCPQPHYLHAQHKMYGFTLGQNSAEIVSGNKLPFHYSRLVLAQTAASGGATTWYSIAPNDPDGKPGIYDEMRMGTANRLGWLGQPVGPMLYPAESGTDIFQGKFADLIAQGTAGDIVKRDGSFLSVQASDPKAHQLEFHINGIKADSTDLFFQMLVKSTPRAGYPKGYPRRLTMTLRGGVPPQGTMFLAQPSQTKTGFALNDGTVVPAPKGAIQTSLEAYELSEHNHRAPTLLVAANARKLDPAVARRVKAFYWENTATMAAGDMLTFKVWKANNAAYSVSVAEVGSDGKPGTFKVIMPVVSPKFNVTWLRCQVDLTAAGLVPGKTYMFRFSTPIVAGMLTAYWANVICAKPDADGNMPAGPLDVTQVAWINDSSFHAVFGFRPLQPGQTYDMTVAVEGSEPVTFEKLAGYNAPGIFYREYENGLVLGNLSFQSQDIDLDKLLPGKKWQHFQGVATQDTKVNNGQPVSNPVHLGPLDGLFLLKAK